MPATSLEGLSREEKLALLRRLSAERDAATAPSAPAIEPADEPATDAEGTYPASFGQRRLWFLERLDPATAHNNVFRAVRLTGRLDVRALERAVATVVARHDALRTRFVERDDEPRQVVEPRVATPLAHLDLADLPPARREPELRRAAARAAAARFDLGRAPLAALTLVRLGDEDHGLFLALHHIVADGWSLGVFFRELSAAYAAHAAGAEPRLPAPAQFAPWAARQRRRLSGAGLERELAHWRELIGEVPTVLDLPTDRPRPALESYRGDVVPFRLEPAIARRLAELGRARRASLFMVVTAGFAALLARWSGQASFLLGTPVAGRPDPELEGAIGFFANTLVLPVDLADAPSFGEALERTRRTTLAALAHQEMPFERLVEELAPARDLARNPLYQAMVALQNAPGGRLALGEAAVAPLGVRRGLSKVDLTLDVGETAEGGLSGYLEYSTDLFERATIEAMAGQLGALLAAATAAPETPVDRLPLGAERPEAARAARAASSPAAPVHRRFAERAAAQPDAVALEADGAVWTYGELARRADRLARRLRTLGVGPEVRVAVVAERSPEAIAAFLAVLAAGGAYVPLDPEYPAERLAFVAADAGAALALATPRLAHLLDVLAAGRPTLALDRAAFAEPEAASGATGATWTGPAAPEAAAYVLYTSGTTGRPKGVVVPHRALANHAAALAAAYRLAPGRRALQFASLAFDIAGEEIYPSLAAGLTLVLRTDSFPLEPAAFAEALGRHRLDLVNVPTPLWHEWALALEEGRALPPPSLELVVVGTEGAQPERLAAWSRALGAAGRRERPRWVNAYGPTETTITATLDAVEPGDAVEPPARVPIGRAVAGAVAHVVDRTLAPLPPGVPGQLAIGGAGVARGYHGRPGATAAVFVPDPFGAPGGRLYLTGDRVRRRPDGRLEFFGRTDDQVKIRGFRIEPAEVEAALAALPAVAEAAVLAREAAPGDRRLVAYVAPRSADDPEAAPAALARALGRRLPPYMVPERFVLLERLPLTPAGKVDRAALPAEAAGEPGDPPAAGARPRGPLEELVAELWAEVLELPAVGADDDFFRLGGHSLLATRVLGRLRDRLGVELPLRALFEAPTVAELARRVAAAIAGGVAAERAPIPRVPPGEPVPASFAQERLWFLERLEPGGSLYSMPSAVALAAPDGGPVDAGRLAASLDALAERHAALRTTFAAGAEGRVRQVIHPPAPLPLPVVDLRTLPPPAREAEYRRLARAEAAAPFDLAAGPLVRARLVRLDGRRDGGPGAPDVLLLTLHHTIADGWSIEVLLRELRRLYAAAGADDGSPPPRSLPPLPVGYADYAADQRRRLDGDALDGLVGVWRALLAEAPRVLELPTDRPRPPVASHRGGRVPLAVPAAATDRVRRLAREHGATPFLVAAAALAALLGRRAGQERVVLGTPIAGRDRPELEGVVGLFVGTLALPAPADPRRPFVAALRELRDASLTAFAHAELPFERLVEALAPERDLSRQPLFQVMLAFQDLGAGRADEPADGEPRTRLVANPSGTARFDLTWNLWTDGDRLAGYLEYATDLFDRTTAERLGRAFARGLEAAAGAPDRPLGELSWLDPAERHALAVEWNDTAAAFPAELRLDQAIGGQAAATPDAVAVATAGGALSYGELWRRAGRLADELARRGAGPGAVVGVCAERSLELMVALVAVLRAGAAYLPLDPSYPPARLGLMAADSGAAVLLVQPELAAGELREALAAAGGDLVELRPGDSVAAGAGDRGPDGPPAGPLDAAYVLYTSGSTGRPKGVVVSHRAIVNRLVWMQRRYRLGADDVVLQKTPIGFDVSVWELFWPLMTGARLALAAPGGHADASYLVRAILEHGVTVMHFVPSMLQVFLDAPRVGECATLRQVVASGEALPPALAERFDRRLPRARLANLYGPTEAAVDVTVHDRRPGEATVPIGRPIENVRTYVLDPRGRPTGIGVPGELHLAGVGLARGYLGRPGLTAERFVPDPYGPEAGGRLYRTGDVAALRADGECEFLGRIDHQVKVRGVRIELGEIEAALCRRPEVREAVVVLAEAAAGEALVAYLVPASEERAPDHEELRRALAEELPGAMVPAAFAVLDALPLSVNGKVDRRALPRPELDAAADDAGPVLPRSPLEHDLAELWARVLRRDAVGVTDDFFRLGGHSLLATQVVTRIEAELGIEVPLRLLFERPTVAALAEAIVERQLEELADDDLARLLDEVEDLTDEEMAALGAAVPDAARGDER